MSWCYCFIGLHNGATCWSWYSFGMAGNNMCGMIHVHVNFELLRRSYVSWRIARTCSSLNDYICVKVNR